MPGAGASSGVIRGGGLEEGKFVYGALPILWPGFYVSNEQTDIFRSYCE